MSITSVINDTVTSVSLVNAQKPLPPTISGYSVAGKDDVALDPAGGQTVQVNGTGFLPGATITFDGSAVSVVTYANANQLTFTSPAKSAGTYTIYVVNPDGGTAIYIPGIIYSVLPTWTTSAGSLGSYYETQSISNTVVASGDAPITYSLYSGSLPTGSTLSSGGVITGTAPVDNSSTTYSFTIEAIDAQLQSSTRSFSLTINTDVVTWVSPANATTYTSAVDSAIANVTLSATDAAGYAVTYTANALPTGLSLSGANISGTPTVVADSSTLLTATAATTNRTAVRTINWSITVANDLYFEYNTLLIPGASTTFVKDASTNNFAVTVNGDTKPNGFNPYTPGYYSVFMNGGTSGDLLSFPSSSTAYNLSGGTWTVEMWMYPTMSTFSDGDCRILMAGTNGSSSAWQVFINSSRIIGFGPPLGGATSVYTSNSAFSFNAWTHVAVVCQAGSARIYVNGISSAGPTNITLPASASVGFKIGFDNVGTVSTQYAGYITNVRINTTTAVYTSNFTPNTIPSTAISGTSLLTCQSNRFIDNSTNNLTVTLSGTPTINSFQPFTPNSSYSTYGSGYFDGNGDYLNIATNSAFNLTGNFTIEFWFYDDGSSVLYPTMIGNATGWSAGSFSFRYNNTGQAKKISIHWNGATPADPFISSSSTFPSKTWHHAAFTRSGSTCTLWIDGTSQGTGTYATALNLSYGGMNIGWSAWDTTNGYFKGYISDVRVNNSTAVYTTAFTPPSTPLTAISGTSLLTLQNNQSVNNSVFLDNSTNNFLVTRAGNTTQGTFSPYGGNWSNYFDGTGDNLSLATATALGTGNTTVEFWFFPTDSSVTYRGIYDGRSTTNTDTGYAIFQYGLTIEVYGSGLKVATNASAFTVNKWIHVALVRTSGTCQLYINGVASGSSGTYSANLTSTVRKIGDSVNTLYPFVGYISNLREVTSALYSGTFTPSTTPLTAITNTSLLTCQSNRLIDSSINNYTLTKNGDTSVQRFSPFNPSSLTPTSYSGYFDGTGDYLNYTGGTTTTLSGDYTFECWVYLNNLSASQPMMCIGDDFNLGLGFFITTSGKINLYGNAASIYTSTGSTVAVNTWTHIAVVRSGSTITGYINGVAQSTATNSSQYSGTTTYIGRETYNTGYATSFSGYLSNVRLVKGVAVYTGAFTVPTSPLQATQSSGTNIAAITGTSTSLLTCQSTTFIDNSTNNFTITANGDSKPTTQNPFGYTSATTNGYSVSTIGGSGYFDGTGDYLLTPSSNNLVIGTGNFAVEAWIYPTAYDNYNGYLSTISGQSTPQGISMSYDQGWLGSTTIDVTYAWASLLTLNAWNHIAITREGATVRWFVNGILRNTATSSLNLTSSTAIIGGRYYGGTYLAKGYISDARIVSGSAVYTSSFVPPSAPLTAITNTALLTNMTNAGIYDASMMNDMESVGDAKLSTAVTKFGGSSMYFDGTGDYCFLPRTSSFLFSSGDFTIELWTYITDTTTRKYILGPGTDTSSHYKGFGLEIWGQQLCMWASSTGTSWDMLECDTSSNRGSTLMSANTWYNITVTRSNGTFRSFINGVVEKTFAVAGTVYSDSTIPYNIGRTAYQGGNFYYNGYMDDLRITLGYARYTSNFTAPTSAFPTY